MLCFCSGSALSSLLNSSAGAGGVIHKNQHLNFGEEQGEFLTLPSKISSMLCLLSEHFSAPDRLFDFITLYIPLLNIHWVWKWKQHGNWNSSWWFDILPFPPQILCRNILKQNSPFWFPLLCSCLAFCRISLGSEIQTPAGLAKNKLLQIFGFHLNKFYLTCLWARGFFPETANIWGKCKLCRGCSCTSHRCHGLGQRSGINAKYKS